MVFGYIKEKSDAAGDSLSGDGGNRSTCHAHFGESKQAENHDGVQDNVGNGAHGLGDHAVKGTASGLKQPFKGDLSKGEDGENGADAQIINAALGNDRVVGLHFKEGTGAEQTEQQKYQCADDDDKESILGCAVGILVVLLTQAAGKQCVDTNTGTTGH